MENFETGIINVCETDDCKDYSSLVTHLTSVAGQLMPDIQSVLKGYKDAGMNNLQIAYSLSMDLTEQFDKMDETKRQRLVAFMKREYGDAYLRREQANEKEAFERRQREREERSQLLDERIRNDRTRREKEEASFNVYKESMREQWRSQGRIVE